MDKPTPHQRTVYLRSLLKKSREEIEKIAHQKEQNNKMDWTYEMDVKFLRKEKQFANEKVAIKAGIKTRRIGILPTTKKTIQSQQFQKDNLHKGIQFPKIPNLSWGEVKITFISLEMIVVEARKIKKNFRYSEIGFRDNRKTDTPDSIWDTFLNLACAGGEISHSDEDTVPIKGKAIVKQLRHRLKHVLQIKEDPFCPYQKSHSYKVKFILNVTPEVMKIVRQ